MSLLSRRGPRWAAAPADQRRASLLVDDDFAEACAPGRTLGTRSSCGARRYGVDTESVLAVDHGALRLQPLLRDGWGRQGVVYGPFSAARGLALAVAVLDGHPASHAGDLGHGLGARLRTWLRAGGSHSARRQLWRWLLSGQRRLSLRQIWLWALRAPALYRGAPLDENFAAGWFSSPRTRRPQRAAVAFVVRSLGPHNGELLVRVGGESLPVVSPLPSVPLLLVVIHQGGRTLYAAACQERVRGLPRLPLLRPLAVTREPPPPRAYAGLQQSCLGQIGFRADSRVYGVRVSSWESELPGLVLSDSLRGRGPLEGPAGEAVWRSGGGGFERGPEGARGVQRGAWCAVEWPRSAALVHVVLGEAQARPVVLFGDAERGQCFALLLRKRHRVLKKRVGGLWQEVARDEAHRSAGEVALQLQQEGGTTWIVCDGRRAFGGPVALRELTRVGFWATRAEGGCVRDLDVFSSTTLPEELSVPLPSVAECSLPLLVDDFVGQAPDLHGRELASGRVWRKEYGPLRIALDPEAGGAVVCGGRGLAARGRTVYTLPWSAPGAAELEIRVRPPGERQGEGHEGRAGLVFWQDADNYVVVATWLHDRYAGASISSFYCLGGFEDIYHAVWANVGRRVRWGTPYALRVRFDGQRFTAWLDGEAVLYRALSDVHARIERLAIHRVGIVANWEWGNDTGSVFERFQASARGSHEEGGGPCVEHRAFSGSWMST